MQHPFTKRYRRAILSPPPFANREATPDHKPAHLKSEQVVEVAPPVPSRFRQLIHTAQQHLRAFAGNEALVNRFSAHMAIIFLTIFAITLSQIQLPDGRIGTLQSLQSAAANVPATSPSADEATPQAEPLTLPNQLAVSNSGILARLPVPFKTMPELPREEITQYTVQPGDTVYAIAHKFDLAPETVLWANPELEDNPHWLQLGQTLNILPFDGIYHQVGGSDTLEKIASAYKVDPEVIIASPLNNLDPLNPIVRAGQWVVVPGGSKPFVPPQVRSVVNYFTSSASAPTNAPVGSGLMGWPITGRISQGYYNYHPAIDIESPVGSPVLAIDAGFVAAAGWDDSGYGYHVVIDHGNGFQSMYAHLQSYYLKAGDTVKKGQAIGEVGMSGRSSGPHLHLEIRQGSIQLNPASFLP